MPEKKLLLYAHSRQGMKLHRFPTNVMGHCVH